MGLAARFGPGLGKPRGPWVVPVQLAPPGSCGGLTYQDVAVPLCELSEGLGDLLPRFGLLKVPVHGAVFFLRRTRTPPRGVSRGPGGWQGAHPPGSPRMPIAHGAMETLWCPSAGEGGRRPHYHRVRGGLGCAGQGWRGGAVGSRGWMRRTGLHYTRGFALRTRVPAGPCCPDRRQGLPTPGSARFPL